MGKYRSFTTRGGQVTLDLTTAMLAATAAKEAELRKLTDSNEVFAQLTGQTILIKAKALNEYRTVGKFSMAEFPGCCGVVVNYHAQIETQFRGKGLGKLMLQIREDAARRANYSVLLATVDEKNEPEKNLLTKNKWVRVAAFKNKKTANMISLFIKILEEVNEE